MLNSSRVTEPVDNDFAHPLRARGFQATSKPEASRNARRVRQAQAGTLYERPYLRLYSTLASQDYQEHQNEIHAKLIAIMGDRLSAHIRSLQAVKWDVPKEGGGANDYMELLVKETVTLHKVLSRYLSLSIVEVCDLLSIVRGVC